MLVFADTSFLCAFNVPLVHSAQATEFQKHLNQPIVVGELVVFEFRQSVRLQVFRNQNDRKAGYDSLIGNNALSAFESDIAAGIFKVKPVEWGKCSN